MHRRAGSSSVSRDVRLCRHPDKNPSQKDAAEFRAVQAAKRVLLDEVARSAGESRDS